ncbi:hypothetical protein [Pseudomonas sp. Q1-7]|uniref:hypothetical protein n=1 Tax=Pseudomonas sp. Q1-7 TaxID=3020843 RepID=UPI0023003768|nr:hypothetical protein [Pseudomonas sp. Q1-7]
MIDFLKLFISFLPFYIKSVEWDGDVLIISGENWSFTTTSAWRVSKDKELQFACWDDGADVRIEELIGLSVVNMSWISDAQPIDPSVVFSDGRRLDVFCSSLYEPWVISLPDNNIYIGNS